MSTDGWNDDPLSTTSRIVLRAGEIFNGAVMAPADFPSLAVHARSLPGVVSVTEHDTSLVIEYDGAPEWADNIRAAKGRGGIATS